MKSHLWCQSLPAESFSNWLPSLRDQSERSIIGTAGGWAGGHGRRCFASCDRSLIHSVYLCSRSLSRSLSASLPPCLHLAAATSGLMSTCCLPTFPLSLPPPVMRSGSLLFFFCRSVTLPQRFVCGLLCLHLQLQNHA